jgi:hypothetical protein
MEGYVQEKVKNRTEPCPATEPLANLPLFRSERASDDRPEVAVRAGRGRFRVISPKRSVGP